jgi:hypothetical protein
VKSPLNPSEFFLGEQGLSPSERQYLEEQDRNRLRKYQETTRKFTKKLAQRPLQAVSNNLDELKEQQRTLREMNQTYFIKKQSVSATSTPMAASSREAKENVAQHAQPTTPTTPTM